MAQNGNYKIFNRIKIFSITIAYLIKVVITNIMFDLLKQIYKKEYKLSS